MRIVANSVFNSSKKLAEKNGIPIFFDDLTTLQFHSNAETFQDLFSDCQKNNHKYGERNCLTLIARRLFGILRKKSGSKLERLKESFFLFLKENVETGCKHRYSGNDGHCPLFSVLGRSWFRLTNFQFQPYVWSIDNSATCGLVATQFDG